MQASNGRRGRDDDAYAGIIPLAVWGKAGNPDSSLALTRGLCRQRFNTFETPETPHELFLPLGGMSGIEDVVPPNDVSIQLTEEPTLPTSEKTSAGAVVLTT